MIMTADAGRSRTKAWAIVLAGGGGSRLKGCTVDSAGHHVPKQFCIVDGTRTLLQLAIARAERLVGREQVVVVVSSQHRKWWVPQLTGILPHGNVVIQPLSRGTAVGVLLPLLEVLARDPDANLVLLPADHYFRDEARLESVIRATLEHTRENPFTAVLVGIEPESATSDFGYIVPRTASGDSPRKVVSFVEKPASDTARALIARGALWNTMILATSGRYLLRTIRDRFPHSTSALRVAMASAGDPECLERALMAIYPSLTTIDLSHDVLQCSDCSLAVATATDVGWMELGTPDRVARFWDEIHPTIMGRKTSKELLPSDTPSLAGIGAGSGKIQLGPPALGLS